MPGLLSANPPGLVLCPTGDGIALTVRLTPKSSRDAVKGLEEGPDGPVLGVRVRAVPEKGKANTALTKLIATWIGVPRSSVTLIAGSKSRYKRLQVAGDPDELVARIGDLMADL